MIPPRAVKQESSGQALKYRVAACRKRLRDRRATQPLLSHERIVGEKQEKPDQHSAGALTEGRASSNRSRSFSISEDMAVLPDQLEESEEAETT